MRAEITPGNLEHCRATLRLPRARSHAGHVVATSIGPWSGSKCGNANESHAHPPHHRVARPITEKPSGTAVNGCAMVISPSEPSARCRAAPSVSKPERTFSE